MPLILDGTMDIDVAAALDGAMPVELEVDDLFGDSVVDLALAGARPLSNNLRKRLDELRSHGCRQYVPCSSRLSQGWLWSLSRSFLFQ